LCINESIKKDIRIFITMEKATTIHMVTILGLMAVGLVLASIASSSVGTVHAQANNNTSAATKNMTNATAGGGNQSAANATNPLAKVPIIGKY
jgi:hypothetical protein